MAVTEPLITTDPARVGGTPVFAGTRVPVQTLMDYLAGGDSLDDFLMDFPSMVRTRHRGSRSGEVRAARQSGCRCVAHG